MMAVSTIRIILASGSPRRKELLSNLGYEFKVIPPDVDETPLSDERPNDHVTRLSLAKARAVATFNSDDLVIGADTTVVVDNTILGKPNSPDDAISMLKFLSGKAHTVYTGLSMIILKENIIRTDYDATKVIFNNLELNDIKNYVASGEPLDKAGAYGIQGMGSFLVHHYEGEFDTVIGFPTKLFKKMLEEVVSCRNH
jgi:septum formation protein